MTRESHDERASIQAVLEALYTARCDGDLEQLSGLFAENGHLRISGSGDGKPIAITANGAAAIRGWLTVLLKSFSISRREMLSTVIEGPRAAVHWRATIHSRITGAQVVTELMDQVEVSAGKIASYVEFFVPL
jgi:ketosteroid isomerase-like protein